MQITYKRLTEFRGADIPSVAEFAILLLGQTSAQLIAMGIASWIEENFRGRSTKVSINRRVIDLDDSGPVRRIIEAEITHKESG